MVTLAWSAARRSAPPLLDDAYRLRAEDETLTSRELRLTGCVSFCVTGYDGVFGF
jgi:hypothetical protein